MAKRKNSRNKGAVGERELAAELNRLFGAKARRGQQYSGLEGEDVVGLGNIHVECKRVEKLNIYEAIEQAVTDAKSVKIPAVFHRRNNKPWLVTVRLDEIESFAIALQDILSQRPSINDTGVVIV
jgi:Holliday junction resolvase